MSTEAYTISDYLGAFRRRSKLFFGISGVVLGTAAAYAFLQPDTYTTSAEMRIDLEGPNVDLLEPIMLTNYADQYIKSLQQKVMTRDNLRKWLEESNAYWHEGDDFSENDRIRQMQNDISVQMVTTSVMDEASGKEVNLITGFRTAFTARDAEAAESVANNVAAAFLAEDRATRVERATSASNFLREQIEAKRQEIADIEGEIATFKEQHAGQLPDLMVLNMTSLERTERELENVQREIRNLQQDRFFREAQLEEIRQRVGAGAGLAALEAEYHRAVSLYGPDHPDVIRIKRQVAALTAGATGEDGPPGIAQLEAELAAARERYSDEHPDVISLKRRLSELRAGSPFGGNQAMDDPVYLQLRAQINATDSNLEGLRERAEELREDQADLQNRIARMPQVERQYQALERELQTANLAHDGLRERLSQAQQTQSYESGEQGARLQQVRTAQAPSAPTGPPRLAITILGLFVAGSLAGGAAVFAEMTDNTIRGTRDIRAIMQTNAIATIPVVQNSISRSQHRRQIAIASISVLMLGTIIVLVMATITG